jgi:hypothetical protein
MFFLHSQLLYFLIIFFSQHVSASMGHPRVSTKTVTSVDDLSLCQRIRWIFSNCLISCPNVAIYVAECAVRCYVLYIATFGHLMRQLLNIQRIR